VGRRKKRDGDPNRAVGYVRVSTDDQELSPDAQRHQLETWCAREGVDLVAVHVDQGVSGAAELGKRPGLAEAIADLPVQRAGVLIVAKLDRLARDVSKNAAIEHLVAENGAKIRTTDGVANNDSPEGQLLRNMMGAFAQYERELIAMRTQVALASKRRNGKRWNCRAPIGFRWVNGELATDPVEQRAVDTICSLRAEGYSFAAITEALNESPSYYPPRGSRWHATTVCRVLAQCERRSS